MRMPETTYVCIASTNRCTRSGFPSTCIYHLISYLCVQNILIFILHNLMTLEHSHGPFRPLINAPPHKVVNPFISAPLYCLTLHVLGSRQKQKRKHVNGSLLWRLRKLSLRLSFSACGWKHGIFPWEDYDLWYLGFPHRYQIRVLRVHPPCPPLSLKLSNVVERGPVFVSPVVIVARACHKVCLHHVS